MKVNIWTVDIVLNNPNQVIQGAAAAGDRNNQDKTGFPNELKRWCFRTLALIPKEWGRTCTRVVVFSISTSSSIQTGTAGALIEL